MGKFLEWLADETVSRILSSLASLLAIMALLGGPALIRRLSEALMTIVKKTHRVEPAWA